MYVNMLILRGKKAKALYAYIIKLIKLNNLEMAVSFRIFITNQTLDIYV